MTGSDEVLIGRPSDGAMLALLAVYAAVMAGPGRACTVALTSTSILGIVYEPRNFTCVSQLVAL